MIGFNEELKPKVIFYKKNKSQSANVNYYIYCIMLFFFKKKINDKSILTFYVSYAYKMWADLFCIERIICGKFS